MGDAQTALDHAAPHFPKQAIVVIHGIGEQMPMDTIKSFVHAAWETDTVLTANGLPNPTAVWSKPDVRTGSLELRRITTRESIATKTFPRGVRSDFYELYWADLSGGSSWDEVKGWIFGLLWRDPFRRVPRDVFLAWVVLWLLAIAFCVLAIAVALPGTAHVGSFYPFAYPPLKWLSSLEGWQLAIATAIFGTLSTQGLISKSFIVPYFGRVVRYTTARPENIAARKAIRERGLALLSQLHAKDYDRIIIVGHSLGSILAYELISYFWASRESVRNVSENSMEFGALCKLEQAVANLESHAQPCKAAIEAYLAAQTDFERLLRLRDKPATSDHDSRWLITDFVTLGSPLSHAEFLMAKGKDDLRKRKEGREYPTSPPIREELDPDTRKEAEQAGFPLPSRPEDEARLLCFPLKPGTWQLHHATPFAATRWTNIYDPAFLVAFGDQISGPAAPVFGHGIVDVDLRERVGRQSWHFTHKDYWKMSSDPNNPPERIKQLREAVDLGGQLRVLSCKVSQGNSASGM